MIPQSGFQYGVEAQNYFKNLISELEDVKLSQGYISVYCELTDNLNMLVIIFYVILSVVAFISVIIILLSIGSVANTIKISAEQNRKFFGVMKAIGMKNRSLRSILTGQIVIMTLAGVIFATVAVNCIIGIIKSLLNSLLSSLFYGIDAIVVCEISIFIPIFIAALLIGFVLLFTKTSLRNFSKMDVISVINEVN
jgi:putative ABC transport system permease protein